MKVLKSTKSFEPLFADDVGIVGVDWEDLQGMLEGLSCQSREAGMEINISKKKLLVIRVNEKKSK